MVWVSNQEVHEWGMHCLAKVTRDGCWVEAVGKGIIKPCTKKKGGCKHPLIGVVESKKVKKKYSEYLPKTISDALGGQKPEIGQTWTEFASGVKREYKHILPGNRPLREFNGVSKPNQNINRINIILIYI